MAMIMSMSDHASSEGLSPFWSGVGRSLIRHQRIIEQRQQISNGHGSDVSH